MPIVDDVVAKAQKQKEFWYPRNQRMQEWLNIEAMVDMNLSKDVESYVTNEPQVMISLANHLLTGHPIRHRVITVRGSDSKKAGETERFLDSIWRGIDETFAMSGQGVSWNKALAYWINTTGWYALDARVESDENNSPVFIADILNPMNVYPQYTGRGTQSVYHYYRTTLADIREKAYLWGTSVSLDGEDWSTYDVIDCWWKPTANSHPHNTVVLVGSSANDRNQILKPETETALTYIPILISPVGGTPYRGAVWDSSNQNRVWQRDAGRSILESNRQTISQFNQWMSFLAEIAKQAAQTPIVLSGLQITQKDLKRGKREGSSIIQTKNDKARAVRLDPGRFPLEMQAVVNVLQGEMQRGGFPYVLYGGAAVDLSGFAINQLLSAATKIIGAQKEAFSKIVSQIDKIFLEEYRRYDYAPITISGKTTDRHPDWFMEEFSADRIPAKLFVEADVKIDMPNDLLNRVSILRQALGNNTPVLDVLTGLEDIMQMEDPYGIIERIKEDQSQLSPEAQRIRIWQGLQTNIKDLRNAGGDDNNKAADMMEQFGTYLMSQSSVLGQAQGAVSRGLGISPQQMPPEASGRSPDAIRALLGMQPTPNAPVRR